MDMLTADQDSMVERAPSDRSLLPDPRLVVGIFRRRLRWFFAPALVIGLGLSVYVWRSVPQYAAEATVIIEPRKANVVNTSANPTVDSLQPENDAIDTEVQILGSQALAGRVAHALGLERYPEYAYRGAIAYHPARPSMHPLANALLGHVIARRIGLSFVVGITSRSNDPDLAAAIANEFARQYLAQQVEAKNSVNSDATRVLAPRLEAMRQQVAAADAALQHYKIAHGLMSAQGSTMAEQEASTLNEEIAKARADYAEKMGLISAARGQIDRGGGGEDVPSALQSATVSSLRAREAEASQRLADITSRYGELHPDVIKTRKELADVKGQIRAETNRIISSLQAEASASGSRLASLNASQGRANGALASNNASQVGYLDLERKAEASRQIYEAFLNRSKEVMSREGLSQADARIGTLSRVPTFPYSPNVPLLLLLGVLGSVIGGIAAVGLAEFLDSGIAGKADVEQRLRVRYAGAVPELGSTLGKIRATEPPEAYLLDHPTSMFAEAFRSLRTVMMPRVGSRSRVFAVTSALPREGKSTTAVCLARTSAASGERTVLVDCDLRRRSASAILLPADADDLLRYLAGGDIDDALRSDPAGTLSVLGTNVAHDAAGDLFSASALTRLIGDLRDRFDVVILDTAPVLALAETRDLAAAADAVLMVARWRKTPYNAVDSAIDLLLGAGARLRGLALTMVDIRKVAASGQEDIYSYHRRFAGYYLN